MVAIMTKKRTSQTRKGNRGVNALRNYCESHGPIFQAEPREDYGIDCYIEVEIASEPQNFLVGLHVKCGPSYKRETTEHRFCIYIDAADLGYWLAANYPVFYAFYDETEDTIYFKHVQAEMATLGPTAHPKKFHFGPDDRASGGRLAQYIRELVAATPSFAQRLEISKAEAPILYVSNSATPVEPFEGPPHQFDVGAYLAPPPECPYVRFPKYTTPVGYSADGNWTCEFLVWDHGPRGGYSATIRFVNMEGLEAIDLPLFDLNEWEPRGDEEVEYNFGALGERAAKVNKVARKLAVQPSRRLYTGHEFMYALDEQRPRVSLRFGAQDFLLEFQLLHNRDSLVFSNSAFRPPRSIPLVCERVTPARLILIDDDKATEGIDLFTEATVRRFRFIVEVNQSHDGRWMTLSVATNDDNACWGTPKVHLIHLKSTEVRELCLRALNS